MRITSARDSMADFACCSALAGLLQGTGKKARLRQAELDRQLAKDQTTASRSSASSGGVTFYRVHLIDRAGKLPHCAPSAFRDLTSGHERITLGLAGTDPPTMGKLAVGVDAGDQRPERTAGSRPATDDDLMSVPTLRLGPTITATKRAWRVELLRNDALEIHP